MRKNLLFIMIAMLFTGALMHAQTYNLELRIVKNGEPITDTLDDGTVITLKTSSDDAEQEND